MSFNIELIIFAVFLTLNFVVGLYFSKGVTTIKEYAVGNRNFSTATIVATLVATWITGEFFFGDVVENYNNGMYMMWAGVIGSLLALLSIGTFFAPRLAEFLGSLSIAEAMGGLFGKNIRILTAISGIIAASGMVAVQFKVAGTVFEYLGVSSKYGVIIAGLIITFYSSLGGIKSVTLTDVIQFFTFGTIIPIIGFFILNSLNSLDDIQVVLSTNKLFDLGEVFDFSKPKSFFYLILFIYIAIPGFGPPIFQRIAMAKDIFQVRRSFVIAAITCTFITISICWISILIYVKEPNLGHNDIVKYLVFNNTYPELKILILVSVMSMVMSTADSYINSTSILIVHDIFEPLNIKIFGNRLIESRIFSALIGIFSIILAFREGSLMQLLIGTSSFYMPIVTVPFIMALLGFRSTEKSVLIGMFTGFMTVILWDYVFSKPFFNLDSLIPAMMSNLIVLVSSHYLLKQPGGWVGIKDKAPLDELRLERKLRWEKFIDSIKNFNIIEICRKNTPTADGLISILGFFVMIVAFSATHTLAKESRLIYASLINILYPITLCSSSLLISYPLWLPQWRAFNLVGVVWNIIMFFVLICFTFLMVLISNFSEIQVIVFMISVIVSSLLISWQWALFNIILGVTSVSVIYYNYVSIDSEVNVISSELKIIYLLLMLTSVLVTFLKPKQEYLETTERQVGTLKTQTKVLERDVFNFAHENYSLANRVRKLDYEVEERSRRAQHQEYEIKRLGAAAEKILNNVNHELRLPIGNVVNFAAMLREAVEKYDQKQLKELTDEVYKNSTRLSSMILNMLDLATLNVQKVDLSKTLVNLSEIVLDRVSTCFKVYLQDKPINFELSVQEEVMVAVDPNYMRQTIDNLVINAIKFSEKGLVKVSLTEENGQIKFTITDQGKGIPQGELSDIFQAFKMGSNSESNTSGRGIGLALCKAVIEAHGGEIKAESTGANGTKFWFKLNK